MCLQLQRDGVPICESCGMNGRHGSCIGKIQLTEQVRVVAARVRDLLKEWEDLAVDVCDSGMKLISLLK
jgi:hypothetical protein